MNKLSTFVKKYWPEASIAFTWVATNFGPQIMGVLTTFVQAHPHWSTTLAAVAVYAARLSQSPAAKVV